MSEIKLSPNGPIKTLLANWSDAAGRTIASVNEERCPHDTYLVFRFTDGAGLAVREDYESYAWSKTPETGDDKYEELFRVYFGIDSPETYLANKSAADAEYAARREREEYHLYLMLKQKFAGSR